MHYKLHMIRVQYIFNFMLHKCVNRAKIECAPVNYKQLYVMEMATAAFSQLSISKSRVIQVAAQTSQVTKSARFSFAFLYGFASHKNAFNTQ